MASSKKQQAREILIYGVLLVMGSYFLFKGLSAAQGFLVPLCVAALLAMMLLPVANWLERRGLGRGPAAAVADILLLGVTLAFAYVVGLQLKNFAERWPQMKQQLGPRIEQLERYISEETGLSQQKVEEQIEKQVSSEGESDSTEKLASELPKWVLTVGASTLLVFVYIFFFLLYRHIFKESLLMMFPASRRDETRQVVQKSSRVGQQYLFGKFTLILLLGIAYAIGLSIVGIQDAILVSAIAAVLTLIPYVGNIIGGGLALSLAVLSGGGADKIVGVMVVFTIAQLIESYVLEPFIVGKRVALNPVFTIIVVVLGGAIWGVAGTVVAIPLLGIVKVVADHVRALRPLAYLFGEEGLPDSDGIFDRFERWVVSKFKSS